MNKNKLEILAKAYNVNIKDIKKSNNKISSNNSTSITNDMLTCKRELEEVLLKHSKKYKITQFDTKTKSYQDVVKYGFLDKHPTNDKLHCIRTFNFFAPYKGKTSLLGEAPLNLIEEINE